MKNQRLHFTLQLNQLVFYFINTRKLFDLGNRTESLINDAFSINRAVRMLRCNFVIRLPSIHGNVTSQQEKKTNMTK